MYVLVVLCAFYKKLNKIYIYQMNFTLSLSFILVLVVKIFLKS